LGICDYLYQTGYYSYLIKVGLGGVRLLDVAFLYFNLCCAKVRVGLEKLFYEIMPDDVLKITQIWQNPFQDH